MKQLKSKTWWNAALTRAVKTAAQSMVASIGTTALLEGVDWRVVFSTAALAAAMSLVTSLGGLPEVKMEEGSTEE